MYVIYRSNIDSNLALYRFYWDNGKLQGVSYFFNRVKTGPWVRYFDDGKISFEGSYNNGRKNGIHKFYFPTGKLSAIEDYKDDVKTGEWFYYNEDGSLLRREKVK